MRTLYDASIPLYQRGLNGLRIILDKAAAHEAKADGGTSLTTDATGGLTPLAAHVVSACGRAFIDVRRVLGQDIVQRPAPAPTVDALAARITETARFLDSVDPDAMNRAAGTTLSLGPGAGGKPRTASATDFVLTQSIPQFFYHLTAVYVILRYHGVSLRKPDFLGGGA